MTTSESKGGFFNKTNRFESIRITNRIESIRTPNWNALVGRWRTGRVAATGDRVACTRASAAAMDLLTTKAAEAINTSHRLSCRQNDATTPRAYRVGHKSERPPTHGNNSVKSSLIFNIIHWKISS